MPPLFYLPPSSPSSSPSPWGAYQAISHLLSGAGQRGPVRDSHSLMVYGSEALQCCSTQMMECAGVSHCVCNPTFVASLSAVLCGSKPTAFASFGIIYSVFAAAPCSIRSMKTHKHVCMAYLSTHTHTHSLWWIWLMKRLKQCQWVLFLIWLPSTAELHTVPALIPLSIFVFQILTFSLTPLKMKNIHTFTHTLGLMCTAWKSSAIIRCVCVRAKKSRCFFLVSRDTDAQAQEMSSLTEMFTLFWPGNERKMSDRTIRGRWASRSTAECIYISCRPLLWRCG